MLVSRLSSMFRYIYRLLSWEFLSRKGISMSIIRETPSLSIDQPSHHRFAAHPLRTFFLLAYGWTWGLIGVAFLGMISGALTEDGAVIQLLASLAPWGPAAAALITAALSGREALHGL